jgi:signal transduction histidine kinase
MKDYTKTKIIITSIISLVVWSLLAWDYNHGGVPSHHILNKKEMPAISNWWGAILMPIFSWFLLSRIKETEPLKRLLFGFLISLLFAVTISLLFTYNVHDVPGYIILSILVIAILFPIYRAECVLGFVLGMIYTFGPVLPVLISGILAGLGFLINQIAQLIKSILKRKI